MRLLRATVRSLLRRRAFASAVVATLSVAIGAVVAIFSIVDAVLLKPLPYPSSDRLVAVYESNAVRRQATALVAPGRLEEWNQLNRTFSDLAASYFENMTDTTGSIPERLEAMRISPRFFAVLGVPAVRGRTVLPDEERFGGPRVVVLSDRFWRRRLNADPAVIGRQLLLGGSTRTVVGVMPPTFRYPTPSTDVWIPTQAPAFFLAARGARLYRAVGRLKPGVTPAEAQADLSAVEARLATQYPATDGGWAAAVVPLLEEQTQGARRPLWLLFGAVVLLLAAACANVAGLTLADGLRREHDVGIRLAIGASRRRVAGELIVEGAVLALAGGTGGLLSAWWALRAAAAVVITLPRADEIAIDARLVGFTLLVALVATMIFAAGPAICLTRRPAAAGLRASGRTIAGGRHSLQRALVAVQIALAIVLLTGAGVLVRSFVRLQDVSPGFDAGHVLTFRVSAQWSEPPDALMNRQLRTIARLESIPGVVSAAFAELLPAGLDLPPGEFTIVGRDRGEHLFASGRAVSGDYFRTLRIPLLEGASCRDDPTKPFQEVVVTRRWADLFFPGENPIGHVVAPASIAGLRQQIIGVADDVRENGLASDPPPLMYTCGLQPYWPDPNYLVRTEPARTVTPNTIRQALAEIEPNRAMYAVRSLKDAMDATVAPRRLNAALLTVFAVLGLLLAAVGTYGVLAQLVLARRHEIGIRMALGAQPGEIVSTVARPAAAMTLCGMVAGVSGALALTRALEGLVFGVSARDPLTLTAAPAALAVVAAVATIAPARRAAALDPVLVLHDE